jgi:hypothetical protein
MDGGNMEIAMTSNEEMREAENFLDTFLILARQALHSVIALTTRHQLCMTKPWSDCHSIDCGRGENASTSDLRIHSPGQELRLFKSGKFAENPSSNLFQSQ